MTPLRLLFVKESQNWPRASGHDVHGYHLMKALAARGHAVSLATITPPTPEALAGLPLASRHLLAGASGRLPLTSWQRRFADYYGVTDGWGLALAALLREHRFDAVVLVARHLLPVLAGLPVARSSVRSSVRSPVRVWYVADDPAWHHLSRVHPLRPRTWAELRNAAVNALYERAYRACYDRVWVVSRPDRTAARLITGCRQVDLIPNGVDADHYAPGAEPDLPNSCVFWGRLDFAPNVDALEWFVGRVWPEVVRRVPAARFAVFGFSPGERVKELARVAGVELYADRPDLRAEVRRRQAVVLPFVSGGGIKNKLLEAAALGMPVVCTRRSLSGTKGRPAVWVCRTAAEWAGALQRLWADPVARRNLGAAARRWVTTYHTWDAAARTAEAAIRRTLARRTSEPSEP
jgi:glycosyltransferase involved in cell wall biosynthesis